MIIHNVKVFPSKIHLPKKKQLAWKIAEIGKSVNVGAGTITCNYDGVKKYKTKIKDNVFIGSNSSLVAPITLADNSIIGAGSVITRNVSKKSLALTRSQQLEVKNYKRKSK